MRAGLSDDLNTAQALGAIFDMVRDVNAAADAARVRKDDIPALLKVLQQFDEIFAVLKDDDAAKVRATVEWAKQEGLGDKISPETAELAKAASAVGRSRSRSWSPSTRRPASRATSRAPMRFALELAENGIILENTKDGVRWKRK